MAGPVAADGLVEAANAGSLASCLPLSRLRQLTEAGHNGWIGVRPDVLDYAAVLSTLYIANERRRHRLPYALFQGLQVQASQKRPCVIAGPARCAAN